MENGSKQVVAGWSINKVRLSGAILMALTAVQAAQGLPSNGGFETGDFSNWTVTVPTGISEFNGIQPAGSAGVFSTWGPSVGMASPISAVDGGYFAGIGSADYAYFQSAQSYDITASQTLSLGSGDTISGWAMFYNGDYAAQDSAWVRIFDSNHQEVSTPWSQVSGGASYRTATPWSLWEWQAAAAGDYTIELGVTTMGDDVLSSYGFFDDINVGSVAAVPEPSVAMMVGMGLAGVIGFYRKTRG